MDLLDLTPSQDGYSMADAASSVASDLKGGLSRTRRDLLDASYSVDLSWKLNRARYDVLRAFHDAHRGVPFLMDLVADSPFLTRHTVTFVTGSFQLASVEGATYVVNASLEVIPIPPDAETDETIIFLFETYGGDPGTDALTNMLERLVNVVMPDYMT